MTPRQIVDAWSGLLPGFDRTHHQLFDIEVNESQDSATAHFKGKAEHFIDKDVWIVEGGYDTTLLKKGEHWVISQFKFTLTNSSGNTKLATVAMERAKKA